MSKIAQVKDRCVEAKTTGESVESITKWVIETLGMKEGMAKRYVKEGMVFAGNPVPKKARKEKKTATTPTAPKAKAVRIKALHSLSEAVDFLKEQGIQVIDFNGSKITVPFGEIYMAFNDFHVKRNNRTEDMPAMESYSPIHFAKMIQGDVTNFDFSGVGKVTRIKGDF